MLRRSNYCHLKIRKSRRPRNLLKENLALFSNCQVFGESYTPNNDNWQKMSNHLTIKTDLGSFKGRSRHFNLSTIIIIYSMSSMLDVLTLTNNQSTLSPQMKRWGKKANYTCTDFCRTKSKFRKVEQGVLPGGVLSPFLFDLYFRDISQPPTGIHRFS